MIPWAMPTFPPTNSLKFPGISRHKKWTLNAKTPANDLIQSGDPVYTNAADAISETNKKEANQWFNDDPLDVYNTATQQFMHLSPQQLNDMDYLTSLAQDPNNVMLFGKDFNNPSGYVALNDIINGMLNTNERGKSL